MKTKLLSFIVLSLMVTVAISSCTPSVPNSWDAVISVYHMKDGTTKFYNHYEWMGGEYDSGGSWWWYDEKEDSLRINADSVTGGHYFIYFEPSLDDKIEQIIEDYFVSKKELPEGVNVILAEDDYE